MDRGTTLLSAILDLVVQEKRFRRPYKAFGNRICMPKQLTNMDQDQIKNDRRGEIAFAAGTKPLPDEAKLPAGDPTAPGQRTPFRASILYNYVRMSLQIPAPALPGNDELLSAKDLVYTVEMTIACAISYWIMTSGLARLVDKPSDFLGGMWAVIATVFVFRDTRTNSISAGVSRLIATCVSFGLCLFYLLLFPFQPMGLAALIGIGTVVMMLLNRREDIITTAITTTVVMVVAAISPQDAWEQPILRLIDTIVGIAVGIGCIQIASLLRIGKRA